MYILKCLFLLRMIRPDDVMSQRIASLRSRLAIGSVPSQSSTYADMKTQDSKPTDSTPAIGSRVLGTESDRIALLRSRLAKSSQKHNELNDTQNSHSSQNSENAAAAKLRARLEAVKRSRK